MGVRTQLPLRRWKFLGYKPQPWQLERLHLRDEPIRTLTTARQVGKSFGIAAHLDELMEKPADDFGPPDVGILAPELGKAKMLVDKYIDFVSKSFGSDYYKTNLQDKVLWIPTTGAKMRWQSAEDIKGVVGFTFSDAVTEESQDIADIVFNRWSPTLGVRNASLVSVGTPDITPDQTWFKAQYIKGLDEGYPDHYSANVTAYECEYWTPERILLEKNRMSEREFRMLMLGEWVDEEGNVLPGYMKGIVPGEIDPDPQPQPGVQYIIGLDIAVHEDFNVMIVGERNTKIAVAYERWNRTDSIESFDRIEEFSKRWNNAPVVIDATGLGGITWARELRERGIRVHEHTITRVNKLPNLAALNADMEHRRIMYPAWPVLIRECKAMVFHRTPAGNLTAEAAAGFHDDFVMALMLLNLGFRARKGTSGGFNVFDTGQDFRSLRERLRMVR